MTLPFTLQQLRILKAVAAEENFTRAAEILYISQPTLSKQIKLLESRLGILLINRQSKNFSLTEGGKILLRYSERILTLCEESCRSLNDYKNGDRGNLIIGASQTTGTYLIPRILSLFAQNYPQINFKIQVDSTDKIAKKVLNRQIDIALVGGDIPKDLKNDLKIENFVEDSFCLILPKSHPFVLCNKKFLNKSELYSLNFISLKCNSSIQKFLNNMLIQNEIKIKKFNIIMELNSIEAIKTAVGLGVGAAFVSSSAIEKEIQLKTISIIKIKNTKITRPISILTNPQSYKSKAFQFFYRDLSQLKS